MSSSDPKVSFASSLAPLMDQFLREKRAIGYRYEAGEAELMRLDRFLADHAPEAGTLSRSITRDWLAKRPHETPRTQQNRFSLAHQFALFLCRHGHPAYVPDASLAAKGRSGFTPYIFTHAQVRRLLQEGDRPAPTALSPLRHLVMPEVFRLLYGCGFRVGEVLSLRVGDVDTHRGVLTVRDGKFGKDRLVPPAPSLVRRLRSYEAAITPVVGRRPADAFYFPSRRGGPWHESSIYSFFRQMLHRCGIPHGGRGKGPRIHDLRHTFAVHTMLRWYREGADLDARLPILATYLGHQSLLGTERYLHLTAELFPEVTARADAAFGDVIPGSVRR